MQREEKQLEAALDSLLQRIGDLKMSIQSLIMKLECDSRLNWPSVLDSYAVISGQVLFVYCLSKFIRALNYLIFY